MSSTPSAGKTCRSRPAVIGPPIATKVELQLPVNVEGRLIDAEEFGDIVIKNAERRNHAVERCGADRTRRGQYACARCWTTNRRWPSRSSRRPARTRSRFPTRARDHGGTEEKFPGRIDYNIVYDPTVFVRDSIKAVIHTLLEAILLVVIVVIIFLQTWRASIIPLLAVPVSLIGTFAVMFCSVLDQRAVALRPGAGHRHRGG